MTLQELEKIAYRVVNEPWGVGHPYLHKCSESWAPYLRFLHAVVKEYKIKLCVELGVYMATATAHMALGNKEGIVVGVDREFHPQAHEVRKMFSNMYCVTGDTTEDVVLDYVENIMDWYGSAIGLLFIDSTHDGDTPMKEFRHYRPYFADECLVVCDDLLGPKHLQKLMQERFWKHLPGEKMELHFLHPGYGQVDTPGFGISIVRKQ